MTINIIYSNLNSLSENIISSNIHKFLCDDSESSVYDSKDIIIKNYKPDTFSVKDRTTDGSFMEKNGVSADDWLFSHIYNEINLLEKSGVLKFDNKSKIIDHCNSQLEFFLSYKHKGKTLSSLILNQEIVDIARKILSYCFFKNADVELYSHKRFNEFAFNIIPNLIKNRLLDKKYTSKDCLLFSVASGLIGLDIKGSIAASSRFSSRGILIKNFYDKPYEDIEDFIWRELNNKINCYHFTVDYWEEFNDDVLKRPCNLLWFLDDYIESIFDLFLIQKLLTLNKELYVTIIPKNGRYGNDMSFVDILKVIKEPIFSGLINFLKKDRIVISSKGPRMGAVNLYKLSPEIISLLSSCDCVFIKGCRAYELVQGGLNKISYFAFAVSREFSENETGFDAHLNPLILIQSKPGEFTYWGFKGRTKRSKISRKREFGLCFSTVEEHEIRKRSDALRPLLKEFEKLLELYNIIHKEYRNAYYDEVKLIVDRIGERTKDTYNKIAYRYRELRSEYPGKMDQSFFEKLLDIVNPLVEKEILGDNGQKLHLLDVGTGSGRDLRYFKKFKNLKAIGIDNSPAFIQILNELSQDSEIDKGSFFNANMRKLSLFKEHQFDIVRHNASLLHLPVTPIRIGADEAIAESFRVLKPGGILYIWAKAGDGLKILDTEEGLGERIFQLFTEKSLADLLTRNQFQIISIEKCLEERPSGTIPMIAVFAQKK